MKFTLKRFNDLSGKTFGKIHVAWPVGRKLFGKKHVENVYLCFCECGTYKSILGTNLLNGATSSCGCTPRNCLHGQTRGKKFTPTYISYHCAKQRCRDPRHENYPKYGAKGVKFLFTSFAQFYAELGERPDGLTLDRIKPEGNYEPGNVRWATPIQQRHNRRKKAA
jgi:hypothetical protein